MTDWRREVEDELAQDEADYEALQDHLLDDGGGPPQGLHRQGWRPFGDPEPWEDAAFDSYRFPADDWDEL